MRTVTIKQAFNEHTIIEIAFRKYSEDTVAIKDINWISSASVSTQEHYLTTYVGQIISSKVIRNETGYWILISSVEWYTKGSEVRK